MKTSKVPYHLVLDSSEYTALLWLSDRGYDGGLIEHSDYSESEDEKVITLSYPEHKMWSVKEEIDSDEDAFMTCASGDLAQKCWALIDSIV
jgi:hypothetical protein